MAITGTAPIRLVQGSAYNYELEFDETTAEFVSAVYISCKELNFCHALIQNAEETKKWAYLFTAEETVKFKPVFVNYSITVHSTLLELEPQILVEQEFKVIANKNPQCGG